MTAMAFYLSFFFKIKETQILFLNIEVYNTLIRPTVFSSEKSNHDGDVNDIHHWNNKYNHSEKYFMYK